MKKFLYITIVAVFSFSNQLVFGQEKAIRKSIEITRQIFLDDDIQMAAITKVRLFDQNGNATLMEEYVHDSLVEIHKASYNSANRMTDFTRLDGNHEIRSSVHSEYKQKGKNKTLITIWDETGAIFSKEEEITNELGQIVLHKINYVKEKLKSVDKYQYDEKGREISYECFDGKQLDFFITNIYNDADLVIETRMGVEYNDANLIYTYEYEGFDERNNWTIKKTFLRGELDETCERQLFY